MKCVGSQACTKTGLQNEKINCFGLSVQNGLSTHPCVLRRAVSALRRCTVVHVDIYYFVMVCRGDGWCGRRLCEDDGVSQCSRRAAPWLACGRGSCNRVIVFEALL
jgi:hypothetical protein